MDALERCIERTEWKHGVLSRSFAPPFIPQPCKPVLLACLSIQLVSNVLDEMGRNVDGKEEAVESQCETGT